MKKLLFIINVIYVPVLFATAISKGRSWDITPFMVETILGNVILYSLAVGSFLLWILAMYHWSKQKNKNSITILLLIIFNVLYTPIYYLKRMR